MGTVHQGLGDRTGEAPASSLFGRRRRGGVRVASGLPWILPALVLCVGLLYYCIGYTGLISTWNWDGISPNPQHVGFGNYTELLHDPLFWGAVRHTVVFFAVTFTVQTFLGLTFAVLLHSRIRLAVIYKVIISSRSSSPRRSWRRCSGPCWRQEVSSTRYCNTLAL